MKMKNMEIKILSIIVLLSASIFSCNNGNSKIDDANTDSTATEEVAAVSETQSHNHPAVSSNFNGNYVIAYINTDTLWDQYQNVIDGMEKLTRTEGSMRKQYESKAMKFQAEYEEYMKKGQAGLLTLKQQQEGEEHLKIQQQELLDMDKSLSERLISQKQTMNKEINDTIVAFIERFRVEKGYTLILQYAYLSGVLAADPALDVTDEVLSRLNAKYEFDKKR